MVATAILTLEDAGTIADEYIKSVFGDNHYTCEGNEIDGGIVFLVACSRDDVKKDLGAGHVTVLDSGEVKTLSEDRIRDIKETGETRAAQKRKELARDEDGHVLRYHARINATSWLANNVDHKIGAKDGFFVPIDSPIWRFAVYDFALLSDDIQLGVIDVDAVTGAVLKPDDEEIEIIIRGACASRRYPQYTTAG